MILIVPIETSTMRARKISSGMTIQAWTADSVMTSPRNVRARAAPDVLDPQR
jgi:hypothetical protein